jgi:prevent-host-death family protein
MQAVNVHEAKTRLSALIAKIESDQEPILLCRNGRPVAEIVPYIKKRMPYPFKPHPKLGGLKIKCDLTAPLSNEEWPEGCR